MSVCKKHKSQGRRSCGCGVSSYVTTTGYGGPDFTDIAVAVAVENSWGGGGGDVSGGGGGGGSTDGGGGGGGGGGD